MLNNKVAAEAPASSGRGDHCRRAALSLTACLLFDCNAVKFNSVSAEANGPAEAPHEEDTAIRHLETSRSQSPKSEFIVCYQAFPRTWAFKMINGSSLCCVPFSALLLLYFI